MCFCVSVSAQETESGIRFIEGEKWEKILKMAAEQDKCIFMDCYTSWCGPCKALAKDVFTRADVGEYFNANFINVKYDMEKGEGKTLHKKFKEFIIGYPTLLLFDSKGNVIHQMAGFQQPEVLISGMKAGKEGESLFAFRARYQQGERDLTFLKKYVEVLNGAFLKDEIENMMKEYMNSIPLDSLKNREIWDFVWTYIKDPYSAQFEYVISNLTHYRHRMKVDMYALESQLVYALGRAVRECTALKKDKEGAILGLTNEPGKMDTLTRLINKASLKENVEHRTKLRIHAMELKDDWANVFNYLIVGRDIGALGYSESYMDDVIQYMALRCTDRALLEQALAIIEGFQQKADAATGKVKSAYYDTLSLLHEKLGNKAKAKEFREMNRKREAALRKQYEDMIKR